MPYSQLILTDASTGFPQMLMSIAKPMVAPDKQGYFWTHMLWYVWHIFIYIHERTKLPRSLSDLYSIVPDKQEQPLCGIRS